MNPERLAEPQALAAVFTVLVLVAALLVFTVGAGNTLPAEDEAPITRERPDRLPSVAEGEAAARACTFSRIPHFSPHDFRHRSISLRFEAGWSDTRIAHGAGQGMKSVTREVYAHLLRDEPNWLLDALARQARGGPVVASTSPMVSAKEERPARADLSVLSGGYRDRTGDLLLAKQALSQLS